MEKKLVSRIGERLPGYYPKDNFRVGDINRVSTKPGSMVYRIKILDVAKGYRDLYAKEHLAEVRENIYEMMGFKDERLLIPRILDYFEDENIVLSEGVKGDTLTKRLLRHIFSCERDAETLLSCSTKMGYAIGSLQNLTNRGKHRLGDLDIYLTKEIEKEDYFKNILKGDILKNIKDQVDILKDVKTFISQYHGDPSPHNILLKDDRVSLLDYSFQDSPTFLDPALYIVSLELMRARFGILLKNPLLKMEKGFWRAYNETTKEMGGYKNWAFIKTLIYLHFLLMYAKRKKTIKNSLVAAWDIRYLLKQINTYGKGDVENEL